MKNLKRVGVVILYVAIFVLIVVAGTKKVTAAENSSMMTELKEKMPITKISAKGNVEVFITQGEHQSITVYDNYYGKNALTQIESGTLRISSYDDKKLSVWVTVKDLKSIEASDKATIYGINEFKVLDLNITLENEAIVNVSLDTYQLNSKISGSSKLILKGNTEYQTVSATDEANLDVSKFASNNEELNLTKQSSITLGNKKNTLKNIEKCENPMCELKLSLVTLQ
jgi:hypothetical protein